MPLKKLTPSAQRMRGELRLRAKARQIEYPSARTFALGMPFHPNDEVRDEFPPDADDDGVYELVGAARRDAELAAENKRLTEAQWARAHAACLWANTILADAVAVAEAHGNGDVVRQLRASIGNLANMLLSEGGRDAQ